RAISFFDSFKNRAFRGHHRLDVETGHELDIVHGEDVGGIDHGNRERCAHAAQGKNLITLGGLIRYELDHGSIDLEVRKIDCGHAILSREEIGDILIAEEVELHQGAAQATVLFLLNFDRLLKLFWGDDLLFNEKVAQSLRHTPISVRQKQNPGNANPAQKRACQGFQAQVPVTQIVTLFE